MGMALVPISVVTMRDALSLRSDAAPRGSGLRGRHRRTVAVRGDDCPHEPGSADPPARRPAPASKTRGARAPSRVLRTCVGPGLAVAAVVAVLLAPTLARVVSGVSERSSIFLTTRVSTASALRRIVTLQTPQAPRQLLLALLGVRWRRDLVVATAPGMARRLRNHRHDHADRLGVEGSRSASCSACRGTTARRGRASTRPSSRRSSPASRSRRSSTPSSGGVERRSRQWLPVAAVSVAVVFAATVGYNAYRSSTDLLRHSFETNARVTPESEAAFSWLHDHAGPRRRRRERRERRRIALDVRARRRAPAFRRTPHLHRSRPPTPTGTIAEYIVQHINQLGVDPRIGALLQRFHARWVYFDERLFDLFHHTMQLDALEHNPRLQPVFERGTVHVFRITDRPVSG